MRVGIRWLLVAPIIRQASILQKVNERFIGVLRDRSPEPVNRVNVDAHPPRAKLFGSGNDDAAIATPEVIHHVVFGDLGQPEHRDRLFRNVSGDRFQDVTDLARINEISFSHTA